ncbi:16078_t:CDS:1, partial [Acaulospora morrowiae]
EVPNTVADFDRKNMPYTRKIIKPTLPDSFVQKEIKIVTYQG